jgi:hypothetical protein
MMLMLTFLSLWPAMTVLTAIDLVSEIPATEQLEKVTDQPANSGDQSFALSLLKKYAETQAKLQSIKYVEELSTELQARIVEEPYAKLNGNSRQMQRIEFCTDGNRGNVRFRKWGNVRSATESIPENMCPYNSLLWDGKTFFEYVASTNELGRVILETHPNVSRNKQRIQSHQTPLWSRQIADEIQSPGASLSVRSKREQIDQVQCYVVDAQTPAGKYTVWIAPERGHNIMKATVDYKENSVSCSLEHVECKKIDGIWIPIDGYYNYNQSFPNGQYTKEVRHRKITDITLKPDHEAIHSFVPDDIKNGAWVQINPVIGQRFVMRDLPLWQDGRVVDQQGRTLFDSGLKNANGSGDAPAD